jgi:3-deoxy-D-manno-octulosonic-acid transferase
LDFAFVCNRCGCATCGFWAALFTKSEFWPNRIVEVSDRKIPLVLVNGRMSSRSGKRWAWLSSLSKPVFSRFDLVLTQNRRFAKQLTRLGVRRAIVAGNLKYNAPPPQPATSIEAGARLHLHD